MTTQQKAEIYAWAVRLFVIGCLFGLLAHFVLGFIRELDKLTFTF